MIGVHPGAGQVFGRVWMSYVVPLLRGSLCCLRLRGCNAVWSSVGPCCCQRSSVCCCLRGSTMCIQPRHQVKEEFQPTHSGLGEQTHANGTQAACWPHCQPVGAQPTQLQSRMHTGQCSRSLQQHTLYTKNTAAQEHTLRAMMNLQTGSMVTSPGPTRAK